MSDPPRIWTPGERCRVTFEGQTVDGVVAPPAAPNGKSLAVQFESMLGGYAGAIAVLWDPDGACFRDLIQWEPVGIDPLPERKT